MTASPGGGCGRRSSAVREEWRRTWRERLAPRWRAVLEVLSDREARVLGLRLGITDGHGLTHAQIDRRLGLSSAAQIEQRALAKVRAALHLEDVK